MWFLLGNNQTGTASTLHRLFGGFFMSEMTQANERGHAELAHLLQGHGVAAIEGSGSGKDTDWPAEKSWFALGLQLDPAKDIGRRFDQDAIVWVGPDAVPQLILLR